MKLALLMLGMMASIPNARAEFDQNLMNTIWLEGALAEKSYFIDYRLQRKSESPPAVVITGRSAEAIYELGAQHGPEISRESCLNQNCKTVEYDGWTCAQLLGAKNFNSGVNLAATAVVSPILKFATGGWVDGIGNAYDKYFCSREIR